MGDRSPYGEPCKDGVLGDEHPDALTALDSLAKSYADKGEADRALPLYEDCLAKRQRILGFDHPDTLESLNNLAHALNLKDKNRALPLYEECLARRKRVFGEDHPDTITSLDNLASFYRFKSDWDRAPALRGVPRDSAARVWRRPPRHAHVAGCSGACAA